MSKGGKGNGGGIMKLFYRPPAPAASGNRAVKMDVWLGKRSRDYWLLAKSRAGRCCSAMPGINFGPSLPTSTKQRCKKEFGLTGPGEMAGLLAGPRRRCSGGKKSRPAIM